MDTCPLDLTRCDRPECRSGVCKRTGEDVIAQCWACGWLHFGRKIVVACARCDARAEDRQQAAVTHQAEER